MLFRPQPRDFVLGIVLAASLLGLAAGTRADVGLWRQEARDAAAPRLLAGGMERTVMRTQSSDHVRAQIERMEARARADERLSGRRGNPPGRDAEPSRDNGQTTQAGAPPTDGRPSTIGPGWQAPGRDASR